MRETKRVQLRRTKGWRKPEGAIVVARPTRWGNPIRIGDLAMTTRRLIDPSTGEDVTVYPSVRISTRAEAAGWFADALRGDAVGWRAPAGDLLPRVPELEAIRAALAGRDLCCWCPLGEACHADVLLRVANGGAP